MGLFRKRHQSTKDDRPGLLARLVRDTRGNTIAIMAAMMIPLIGMVGSGIDMSRMYLVKTRLQHACDAGALAGRKAMGGGIWTQSSPSPNGTAQQFFTGNFNQNAYGVSNVTPGNQIYTENAGKVSGAVSADVPMTLMQVFGIPKQTLTVKCDAQEQLPNTDVMFVLDNTGSMACRPDGSSCGITDGSAKIDGLKVAVKCFYQIVAQLPTDATCATGTPSGGTSSQVQIRFGFMPYSSDVNVGKLLPSSYFANSWTYQSRASRWWIRQGNPAASSKNISATNVPQSSCNDQAAAQGGYNSNQDTYSSSSTPRPTGTVWTNTSVVTHVTGWSAQNNGTCYATQTTSVTTYRLTENVAGGSNDVFLEWHYGPVTQNVTPLKNGSGWNSSLPLPIGAGGTNSTVNWDGCIEERQTVQASSYNPIPSGAKDLNIDLVPTQSDTTTLWAPALSSAIYIRSIVSSYSQLQTADDYQPDSTAIYTAPGLGLYSCPAQASKLQSWPDPVAFDAYVNGLTPNGGTSHDVGMLWGARFMSPTGIFASENATTPQGGTITRHMIFMTDGVGTGYTCLYGAYGVAYYDKRQTNDVGTSCASSQPNGDYQGLTDQVNARLDALCTAVKNKNITLWVVSFGAGVSATDAATDARLQNCATDPSYFFHATDAAGLQSTFAKIANNISALRITK